MLVGLLGMVCSYYSKPDVAWRKARAAAEVERGRIRVMEADRDKPKLLALKLEYARRSQLDLQGFYYRHRGAQHGAKVRRSS
jgi:hypothetical protein